MHVHPEFVIYTSASVSFFISDLSFQQQSSTMSELKLRRLTEHNQRLREDLNRPRVRVSEASAA